MRENKTGDKIMRKNPFVLDLIVFPQDLYVLVHTPSTSECDLI